MRRSARARCSSLRSEERVRSTVYWLRLSLLTSRRTAHMEAVQPVASSTGSPVMCRVRIRPSGRRMRISPSIGRPSTRQSVTIDVNSGWSSGRSTDGSSSRDSAPAAGSLPKISYSSSDQLTSSVSRFHSALPTLLSNEPAGRAPGVCRAGPPAGRVGWAGTPSLSCPSCSPKSSSWFTASSQSARSQRSCGSSSSSTELSRRTAATSPRSRRVRLIRASTASRPGGRGAGRSANRWDGITYSDTDTARPVRGGGPDTTVAQAGGARKGFGNTRQVVASGICHRLTGVQSAGHLCLYRRVDASRPA